MFICLTANTTTSFMPPCWTFRTATVILKGSRIKNDHWLNGITSLLLFSGIFSLSTSEGEMASLLSQD